MSVEARVTDGLTAAGSVLLVLMRQLAPLLVPLAPAWFFGSAVYEAAGSLAIGVVAAVGLESAGILAAHYAVRFYAREDGRWLVATGGAVLYLVIGIAVIWLLEATSRDAKLAATAMFLVAGIVYVLIGLAESDRWDEAQREADSAERRRVRAENRAWKRDQAELRLKQAHELALASQVTKTAVLPATVDQYVCPDCGREFATVQAVNAHARWCEPVGAHSGNGVNHG